MLLKLHKASDKAKLFLLVKTCFHRYMQMTKKNYNSSSSSSTKVQALYELCKNSFTSSGIKPPSSQVVHDLCSLLDTVGPAHVGLEEKSSDDNRGLEIFGLNGLTRAARWAKPITYLDIYGCDSFTAYDWIEPACFQETKGPCYRPVRLAKLAVDKVLTPQLGTPVLYPKSGDNLHCFTAVTPCAVFDILSPSYREDAGRTCTYYIDYPYSTFSAGNGVEVSDKKEEYAWLSQIDTPWVQEYILDRSFRFSLYRDDLRMGLWFSSLWSELLAP